MRPGFNFCLVGAMAGGLAGAAAAQAPQMATMAQDNLIEEAQIGPDEEIVVEAERLRGQLAVEQAPVLELDEQDILAVGADSIAGLIAAIGPQTGSSRGRGGGPPVFLVNGIRIGSFRELRSYPPEAVAKVEVMPEEVAQRFGFPPDRRVVNLVLKDNYSSREAELEIEAPERGGYWRSEQEFTLLTIDEGARLNINLEASDNSLLTEAERGIAQSSDSLPEVAGDPDPARFRSLVADSRSFEATVNWARASLERGSSLSLNATYEREENRSLSGLNSVVLSASDGTSARRSFGEADPLAIRSASDTFSSAASWNRPLGLFRLTATLDASYALSEVEIDRRFDTTLLEQGAASGAIEIDAPLPARADNGFDTAQTQSWAARGKMTARGAPLLLPAGELTTTFDLGYEWDRIESSDTRTALQTRLTRGDIEAGANLVIPLTSRREGVWDALGSFTLNLQAGINHLSDFGTLADWSAGLTWSVWPRLDLQATRVWREVAPSLGNLGNPRIETFNVPVFDLVTGESVLATVISGGNPDLVAETQRDWRFSANWELPFWDNTRVSAEYIRNRSRDVTGSLPALSLEVEAAFPGRVVRDGAGTLVGIDRRPVTYAATRNERLVLGLTTRGSWGEARREGGVRAASSRQRRESDTRRPAASTQAARRGGAGVPRFGRDGRGRYFVNLTHTIELENRITIAEGGPVLDLLGGAAQGDFPQPRHSTRLEAGFFRSGKGLRISGRYTGKSRIDGNGALGSGPLFFDDWVRFDLRVFVNLGQVLKREKGPLSNLRLALRVDNLFDAQRRVGDGNGEVPLRYQPFLLDPNGRYLGIDLRKLF